MLKAAWELWKFLPVEQSAQSINAILSTRAEINKRPAATLAPLEEIPSSTKHWVAPPQHRSHELDTFELQLKD